MIKKIIHVQLLPLMTGVQTVTLNELKGIQQISSGEFEIGLVVKCPGLLTDEFTKLSKNVYFIPSLVRQISFLSDLKSFFLFLRLFRKIRPYIVHTHSSKTGILGRFSAKISGVKVVIHTVHGFSFPSAGTKFERAVYFIFEYFASKCMDALIVMNNADLIIARDRLKIPPNKIHYIPNGVLVDKYNINPGAVKFRGLKNEVTIGMVGRLWSQKNPICLLMAVNSLIKSTHCNIKLIYIGDGELGQEIIQKAKEFSIEENVFLAGWTNDVPKFLSTLDVFVLPSRWEGMPLSIIEAMVAGIPVIASNIPGNSDLIEDGINGLLFESENYKDLAKKIDFLIKNYDKAAEMAAHAREVAIDRYSSERHNKLIYELYKNLGG